MSVRRQMLQLVLLFLIIGLAAWYALSGPLDGPMPAPPPAALSVWP